MKKKQFIDDKIIPFNRNHAAFTQNSDFVSLNFHIKHKGEFIMAGINSFMYCWARSMSMFCSSRRIMVVSNLEAFCPIKSRLRPNQWGLLFPI